MCIRDSSNVASALYDNFKRLEQQIRTLNRTLAQSPAFSNDERYQFRCEVAPEFRELHRFIPVSYTHLEVDKRQELEQARQREKLAAQNQSRLQSGRAELRADVVRLMSYLEEADIPCRPVCDLVQVSDPDWQGAMEAYLRTHVEALLVPAEHEQRAVALYRGLKGHRLSLIHI